jgi:HEAT repeat protein
MHLFGPISRYRLATAVLTAGVLLLSACSGGRRKAVEKKSMEELLEDLANQSDDRARVAAIRQLAKTKDQSAIVALIVSLNDDSDSVRIAAASALADSKDPRAAEALWAAVRDVTRGRAFRLAAARALAHLHDVRAAEPLVELLPTAPSEASASLLELGPAALPALIGALRVAATRDASSSALVSMGTPAVAPLMEMLRKDESKSARLAAAAALAEMDDPRANEALTEVLKSSGPEFTVAGYRFLIRQGRPGTESRLIDVLNTYGRRAMADDFLSSGNAALKTAAEDWARKRDFSFTARTSDLPEVRWGGLDSSIKRLALYHFDNSLASVSGIAPLQSSGVSFVPGKWGSGLTVAQKGILKYPLMGNLDFRDGTIEMWISPKFDGTDSVYGKHTHPLLLYHSPAADQFLVSEGTFGGFYAGSVIRRDFKGAGGGTMRSWKAGTWHHIAFTYSSRSARQRLYLDGVMTVPNSGPMPPPDPGTGNFTVGCDPYGNWTAFVVDELLILNGEKSPDAIRSDAHRSEPFPD